MDCGIRFVIVGGWLDSVCTYCNVLPGLEKGLYAFLFISNVRSKKSTTFMLAVAVIFRPS